MSRNNFILVLQCKRRFYVIRDVCADIPCGFASQKEYFSSLIKTESRFTLDMGKALIIAHRHQKKDKTEYGVIWETL